MEKSIRKFPDDLEMKQKNMWWQDRLAVHVGWQGRNSGNVQKSGGKVDVKDRLGPHLRKEDLVSGLNLISLHNRYFLHSEMILQMPI